MYQLYIANKNYSSWSLRPWVLMRELGIAFSETLVPFAADATFDLFRRFSPTGKVPCLIDGAISVWDSLAIAEYVAERHPGVWPQGAMARAWARCAAAEMHSGFSSLRNSCPMNCGVRIRMHTVTPALQRDFDRLSELWSQGLQRFGGPFLAGDRFTAVDAFFAPVAFRVQSYGIPLGSAAAAYAERLLRPPSMLQWYEAALAETWRDAEHDKEIAAAGVLLSDLRYSAVN